MRRFGLAIAAAAALALGLPGGTLAYPLFGADDRGISRLEPGRLAHEGVVSGGKKHPGQLLSLEQVDLRLLERSALTLPAPDPGLAQEIRALLGDEVERYGIAILDLSNPAAAVYAEVGADVARNPGSVGKIVVATAIFQALADAYPDDEAARLRVLRDTVVTADEFILTDHHTVQFWNTATREGSRRQLGIGDRGTLWEWVDWMMSASSNAAAANMQSHAMLLTSLGRGYPVSEAAKARYFADTPRAELGEVFARAMQEPLLRAGLEPEALRQGSFFTQGGKRKAPGTSSHATPRGLLRFLLLMEQGRIVDPFSSREIKRLLYMTERRIRYASSPALADSAVYFKSGSFYQCVPEAEFVCRPYAGNKRNIMNSIAVVETPAGGRDLFYIVTLTSNVLRRNSAVEHQTLATRIHRIIERRNGYAAK